MSLLYLLRHGISIKSIKDMEADDADFSIVPFVFKGLREFEAHASTTRELEMARACYMAFGGIEGGKEGFEAYKKYTKKLNESIEDFNSVEVYQGIPELDNKTIEEHEAIAYKLLEKCKQMEEEQCPMM